MLTLIGHFAVDAFKTGGENTPEFQLAVARFLKTAPSDVTAVHVLSRSIDSRHASPELVYQLIVELDDDAARRIQAEPAPLEALCSLSEPEWRLPESKLQNPLVVGAGPAGLFGALALAHAGACPIVLDAGQDVERRYTACQHFLATRRLDPDSNLLIGEGGAGTFSDGKLYTGTRDVRGALVLHELARAVGDPSLRYDKRPHVGSDRLREAVAKLRMAIIARGGHFRFGCRVTGLLVRQGRVMGVRLASGETLEAPAVLLAPGLGGRDLIRQLIREYELPFELKPFQIGCRIEHEQELIDRRQYHLAGQPRPAVLGAAEYHLVSQRRTGTAQVSSFCMCPGGEILNATAWPGRALSNGMSDSARSGRFANGALIATFSPDLFASPQEAWNLLENLEKRCFEMGGGDYALPAQDAAAFLAHRSGLSRKEGSCRTGLRPGRIDELLPPVLRDGITAALADFDKKIPGFIRTGVLNGVETCVSSPVKLIRDDHGESPLRGLWPAGEGVGKAGGILSAAIDGIRAAEGMLAGREKTF